MEAVRRMRPASPPPKKAKPTPRCPAHAPPQYLLAAKEEVEGELVDEITPLLAGRR